MAFPIRRAPTDNLLLVFYQLLPTSVKLLSNCLGLFEFFILNSVLYLNVFWGSGDRFGETYSISPMFFHPEPIEERPEVRLGDVVPDIGFHQIYVVLMEMKFFSSSVLSSVGLNNESQKNEKLP